MPKPLKCKHKNRFVEKVDDTANIGGVVIMIRSTHIDTYCADCGLLLKKVEVKYE